MITALLAAATLCVAVPSATAPVYFDKGVHLDEPRWMTACNVTPTGWSQMKTAPRDGRVIELRNAFGLLPTYSLNTWAKIGGGPDMGWVEVRPYAPPQARDICKRVPPSKWMTDLVVCSGSGGTTFFDQDAEPGLAWRPLAVDPKAWVAHNPTSADWRRAGRR